MVNDIFRDGAMKNVNGTMDNFDGTINNANGTLYNACNTMCKRTLNNIGGAMNIIIIIYAP